MLAVILSLLAVLIVLLLDEYLWRKKIIHGELKRKLVHIAVTSFVAFWPWIMGWKADPANRYCDDFNFTG
jgi:hypothetical protein